MKTESGLAILWIAVLPLAFLSPCRGEGGSSAAAASIDAGGLRIGGGGCTIDGSIGGFGGIAANGPVEALKAGYIGQLTEVTNVVIAASPAAAMNEGGSVQLQAVAGLDDATSASLDGSSVIWIPPAYPVSAISSGGAASSLAVCSNTWGRVSGSYLGATGSCAVLVLDHDPDNFGLYAGDQVPDGWQVAHFGVGNPAGMGAATNATGQSNLYAYVADLDPADSNACFRVTAISNLPPGRVVCFRGASAARVYRLQCTSNMLVTTWTNLPGAAWRAGSPGQMSLSDTNAASARFYRVQVAVP